MIDLCVLRTCDHDVSRPLRRERRCSYLCLPQRKLLITETHLIPLQLLPRRGEHILLSAANPPKTMQVLPTLPPQLLYRPSPSMLDHLVRCLHEHTRLREEPPQPMVQIHLNNGFVLNWPRQVFLHHRHGVPLLGTRAVDTADTTLFVLVTAFTEGSAYLLSLAGLLLQELGRVLCWGRGEGGEGCCCWRDGGSC